MRFGVKFSAIAILATALALPALAEPGKHDRHKHESRQDHKERGHKERGHKERGRDHDRDRRAGHWDNCPPGLAKKSPACIPPGQAKKRDRDDHRDYRHVDRHDRHHRIGEQIALEDYIYIRDPQAYGLDTGSGWNYYRDPYGVYAVDPQTRKITAILGLIEAFSN